MNLEVPILCFQVCFFGGFLEFLKSVIFVVGYITGSNLFPEPLSKDEEREALIKMNEGDSEARNLLIEKNLRLVAHVCKKYTNTRVEQDDLLSIGTIGLIKGINSFKIEKGAKLSTYVSRCIDKAIVTCWLQMMKLMNYLLKSRKMLKLNLLN